MLTSPQTTSLPLLTFFCETLRFSIIVFVCQAHRIFECSAHCWWSVSIHGNRCFTPLLPFINSHSHSESSIQFNALRIYRKMHCALVLRLLCSHLPFQPRLWLPVGLSAVKQRRHRRTHNAHKAHKAHGEAFVNAAKELTVRS